MEKLALKIARWLGQNGGNEDDIEVYVYGIEVVLNYILTFGLLTILSIIFDVLAVTLVWMGFWVSLRYAAGGGHASTQLRCFLLTMLTGIISVLVIVLLNHFFIPYFLLAGLVFSNIIVFVLAPVINTNNPIPISKRNSVKKTARIIIVIESILVILFFIVPVLRQYSYAGTVSMIGVTTLSLIGYFQNKNSRSK